MLCDISLNGLRKVTPAQTNLSLAWAVPCMARARICQPRSACVIAAHHFFLMEKGWQLGNAAEHS